MFFLTIDTILLVSFVLLLVTFLNSPQPLSLLLSLVGILFFAGFLFLRVENSILVGFLWILDLGLVIVFLLFMLNLTTLFYLKYSLGGFFSYLVFSTGSLLFLLDLPSPSFQTATWVNYFLIFNNATVSELALLREVYFFINASEFLLINVYIFFMLVFLVLVFFTRNRTSSVNVDRLRLSIPSTSILKDQDFLKQQFTSSTLTSWGTKGEGRTR